MCCDVLKGILQGAKNFAVGMATPPIVGIVQVANSAINGDFTPLTEMMVPGVRMTNNATDAYSAYSSGDVTSGTEIVTEEALTIGVGLAGARFAKGTGSPKSTAKSKASYSNLKEPNNVGSGKKFTQAQKARILEANKEANGGELRSDKSGQVLDAPVQSKKGVPANMKQAEVDHVNPRSKGSSNSNSNAQVLSKKENIKKSDNIE